LKIQEKILNFLNKISPELASKVEQKFSNREYVEKWMITRIKFKCLVCIESILEGNKNIEV